jgi:hypothetical protein
LARTRSGLYDSLATNPTLRTTVAEQAISAFVTPTPGPVSEAMVTPAPDAADAGTPSADSMAVIPPPPSAGEIFKELSETSLPFGYNDRPGIGPGDPDTDLGAWLRWLVRKIPGLVVTTFAVALGAPFWFDVLNRLSNLRAAGKRPESTNTSVRPSSAGPST